MKALPTKKQLEWADLEIGVIIHYDITVFEQNYKFRKKWGYQPDVKKFAPDKLDCEQWMQIAKAAGAKYAVLVAKHCTGFALFPSEANDYNVKNATYNKDIVENFVLACKKFNIKPGVYYSTSCNAYENVDNPGTVRSGGTEAQVKYNQVVKTQLEELWGKYGEWFEIWFDGGTLAVEKGGLDIGEILNRLQTNAITFQGDKLHDENNLRWVGNEQARAPFDCYSTITGESQVDGVIKNRNLGKGDKDGEFWKPAECDAPNRHYQWFFKDKEEKLVLPTKELVNMYYNSVGRNCNLLLGMVVDNHGLVPELDKQKLLEFGKEIKNRFSKSISSTKGKANDLLLRLHVPTTFDHIVLKEDITKGHSIFAYRILAEVKGKWKEIFKAEVIGHKRIARIKPTTATALKLEILEGDKGAIINEFAVYNVNKYTFSDKLKLKIKKFM